MSIHPSESRSYDAFKRFGDILVSASALIVLSPLLLIISVAVACCLGRPVLFRQVRPGRHGKPFTLYKFRSMAAGTGSDEQRMTRFGRLLRASSLDELPELLNVLKGEMSLVGPRPLLMEYLPLYSPQQNRRHEVRPGITGLAQVSGRNRLDWPERFRLDVEYVDNRSFVHDVKIIARTLTSLVSREGISAENHATSPAFTGNHPPSTNAPRRPAREKKRPTRAAEPADS